MNLLLISLILTAPNITVSIPDSVQVGAVFSCEITLSGENISSMECVPVYSPELQYLGSSSMHSFSSVSTPTGTSITSEIRLSMSFSAAASGMHTIGPLILTASGREIDEIPLMTVYAIGESVSHQTTSAGSAPQTQNEIAWIEIEIDTTGRVYPGQTFNLDYYIYKSRSNVQIVDLFLEPPDYATSSLIGDVSELQWVRCKSGVYKTWLATLEVTPAFACTLSLPVLRGRIGIPGGRMFRPFPEYRISSEGNSIPVFPFPAENKPDNFSGISGRISFQLERITRGYSSAGERCLQLSVSGPGYSQLKDLPELTVSGPAELLPGGIFEFRDKTNAWHILIEPSDSGTVIVGPDSVAWFDTSAEEYRQAGIPPCTLSVYALASTPVDISALEDNGGSSALIWIVTVSVLFLAIVLITLRYRSRITGSIPKISDAKDIEELLTAMGYMLSEMLTDSRTCMGAQELDDALDERVTDIIISRRVLRHWKDLELMLSGKTVSAVQFEKLKKKSLELVSELESNLHIDK